MKKPNSSVPALLTRIENGPVLGDDVAGGSRLGDVEPGGVAPISAATVAGALDVDVADHDHGPLGGEARRGRGADPARAAGDQRRSSLEPHRGEQHRYTSRFVGGEAIPIIGGTGALGYGPRAALGAGRARRW